MDVPVEIETLEEFDEHRRAGRPLAGCVFQGLDLRGRTAELLAEPLEGAAFLGCELEPRVTAHLIAQGAAILPRPPGLPFNPFRSSLYSITGDLYQGYQPGVAGTYADTLDARVYAHYRRTGGAAPPSILESLFRRLHDHGMSDALEEQLHGRRVVAIMGGHALARGSDLYADVARIGRGLAQAGFLVVTGGGPGAMEAAQLGAWLAGYPDEALQQANALLTRAPAYTPIEAWLDTAFDVRARFPRRDGAVLRSIGIPTWHYGHEPPNVFADAVAKYFANSEREDGLLAIARAGVVFAPGSAGTIQEIFQDAAQNHYAAAPAHASPMVFLGVDYWTQTKPVYPLLRQLAEGHAYGTLLCISDSVAEILEHIARFTPE